MKILIATLILGASFPVNAYEKIGDHINREGYESLSTDFQLSTRTFSSYETVIYQSIIPITAPLMSY